MTRPSRRRAYKIECRYVIRAIEFETAPDGEEYERFGTTDRLEISKDYVVDDAVTLTRALQLIDKLDQSVTDSLGGGQ